jgi:hypothetical protein
MEFDNCLFCKDDDDLEALVISSVVRITDSALLPEPDEPELPELPELP